jgi:hypothetical protein
LNLPNTANATILSTADVGTMATQNADNVAITGGTIEVTSVTTTGNISAQNIEVQSNLTVDNINVANSLVVGKLIDPIIELSGTNGESGQVLFSQGANASPTWGTVPSPEFYAFGKFY